MTKSLALFCFFFSVNSHLINGPHSKANLPFSVLTQCDFSDTLSDLGPSDAHVISCDGCYLHLTRMCHPGCYL